MMTCSQLVNLIFVAELKEVIQESPDESLLFTRFLLIKLMLVAIAVAIFVAVSLLSPCNPDIPIARFLYENVHQAYHFLRRGHTQIATLPSLSKRCYRHAFALPLTRDDAFYFLIAQQISAPL